MAGAGTVTISFGGPENEGGFNLSINPGAGVGWFLVMLGQDITIGPESVPVCTLMGWLKAACDVVVEDLPEAEICGLLETFGITICVALRPLVRPLCVIFFELLAKECRKNFKLLKTSLHKQCAKLDRFCKGHPRCEACTGGDMACADTHTGAAPRIAGKGACCSALGTRIPTPGLRFAAKDKRGRCFVCEIKVNAKGQNVFKHGKSCEGGTCLCPSSRHGCCALLQT
jgi:hypothetical protein